MGAGAARQGRAAGSRSGAGLARAAQGPGPECGAGAAHKPAMGRRRGARSAAYPQAAGSVHSDRSARRPGSCSPSQSLHSWPRARDRYGCARASRARTSPASCVTAHGTTSNQSPRARPAGLGDPDTARAEMERLRLATRERCGCSPPNRWTTARGGGLATLRGDGNVGDSPSASHLRPDRPRTDPDPSTVGPPRRPPIDDPVHGRRRLVHRPIAARPSIGVHRFHGNMTVMMRCKDRSLTPPAIHGPGRRPDARPGDNPT